MRQFLLKLNGTYPVWSRCTYFLERGVPQGPILGPVLFILTMTRTARQIEQETSASFTAYMVDIAIQTEGHDFDNTDSMITELQAAVA